MLDRILKIIADDERLIALALVAIGSAIALTHLSHAYEVGAPLASAGLMAFKSKQ
jgi:hypothetical protein